MNIVYRVNHPISYQDFIEILQASGLDERRPVNDVKCMKGMVENSNLLVSAWLTDNGQDKLVGIARAMTDLNYACYLSDLAVDAAYQNQGIGRELISKTQEQLEDSCKLILIAAPDANDFYPKLGFKNNSRCWVI